MGQLLNLGFKNVCNNGNLGNTPNLTPAEIYNLIKNFDLTQYELLYSTYPGTFTGTFYNASLNGTKVIYNGAGEMINTTFLNSIPQNSIIRIRIETRALSGSFMAGTVFVQKTIGGTDYQDTINNQIGATPSVWPKFEILITAQELKSFDQLLYSQIYSSGPAMYIKINIYNVTNI
jgi:hypothetical protein